MRSYKAAEERLRALAHELEVAVAPIGWIATEELDEPDDTQLDRLLNRWLVALSPTVVLGLLDELDRARAAALTAPPPAEPEPAGKRCLCGDLHTDHKTRFAYGQAVAGPCKLCGCHGWEPADG